MKAQADEGRRSGRLKPLHILIAAGIVVVAATTVGVSAFAAASNGPADDELGPNPVVLVTDDGSEHPSEPGHWIAQPSGTGEGEAAAIEELVKVVSYDEVFTKDGVVVKERYMDWYIDVVLREKNPMALAMSNPGSYIDGNEYYAAIVATGPAAMFELEQEIIAADNNGLSVFLFALAIEDIAKADYCAIMDDEFAMSDGKRFVTHWTPIRRNASQAVNKIILGEGADAKAKLDRIAPYGILAAPALEEMAADEALDEGLRQGAKEMLAAFALSDSDTELIRKYIAS
jgi:hypothetical protein